MKVEDDKGEEEEKTSWRCWLRTLFAGSGAMLAFVFTGMVEAQSAVLLPQLKDKDSRIPVTPEEETWIASLGILTSPISAIISGPIVDMIGRKKGLQFFYVNIGVGFGIIACATEVWHLYVGRIICAFAVGLEVVAVVYLAEICTKKQRSAIFSVMFTLAATGVLLTYVVGGYLPWNIASGIFSLACFAYLIIQSLAPESPAWLFKTGRIEASIRSLQRLGRSNSGVLREVDLLKLSTQEKTEKFEFRIFLQPTVWKPFLILSIYHFLATASGAYDIMAYTVEFIAALGTSYDPLAASILLSVIRVIVNATAGIYFVGSVSRRLATALSALLMTISLLGTGLYSYVYREAAPGSKPHEWVPIALMILNIGAGAIGVTSLPWLMSGEMFPLEVRGAMTGAAFVIGSGFMFLFIKIYYIMLEGLQMWGLLLAWAVPSAMAVAFGVWILPETQGKTLYEIERGFLPQGERMREPPQVAPEQIEIDVTKNGT
nr:PREDICTED: facilitated trehalose transporter Tret1-like [Bemisia tabaci]